MENDGDLSETIPSCLCLPSLCFLSSTVPPPLSTQLHNWKTSCTRCDPLTQLYLKRQPHKPSARPAWGSIKQQTPCSASRSSCRLHTHGSVLLTRPLLPLTVKAFVIWCWLINSNGNTLVRTMGRTHTTAFIKNLEQGLLRTLWWETDWELLWKQHTDGNQDL